VTIGGLGSTGKYYVLDNNIDLVGEWVPINDFRGTFDGQGYSINNLYVLASSNRQYAGLFGQITVSGVTIKNVGVNISTNGITTATSNARVGGLIGYSAGIVTIENSYITGNIVNTGGSYAGYSYVGGLIGCSTDIVTIENSYATGNITAATGGSYNGYSYAGGLIGYSGSSVAIENSYATNNISGSSYAGGLIGYSGSSVAIENSYATGNIAGRDYAGGLIGYTNYVVVTIENSYTTGNITAPGYSSATYAGGLIGYNNGGVTVKNSYVTGDVTAPATATLVSSYAGGLIGHSIGSSGVAVENCYVAGNIIATGYNVYVGGLIGYSRGQGLFYNYQVVVENSYTTGNVTLIADNNGCAGGLIGYSRSDVIVTNSCTTGNMVATVRYATAVGGLVGEIGWTDSWGDYDGTAIIENSYTTGNITASGSGNVFTGGLIGYIVDSPTVKNSYTTGNITATASSSVYVGGLISYSDRGVVTVENSYATGNIAARASGSSRVGGFIGYSNGGVIMKNCYTTCDVVAVTNSATNSVYVGGLIGDIGSNIATVENCYTVGDVSATARAGSAYAGDLAGLFPIGASVTRCYRLSTQTIIGDPTNYVGTSLTQLQMRNQQSFVGWNFEIIWAINPGINEGYPYLVMGSPVIVPTYSVVYNGNGGSGVPTDSNRYAQGATVTVSAVVPSRQGYTFAGWLYIAT